MKPLTCDFKGCEEIAQWYRKWKGELLKLCTKHEALLAKEHWGKHVDESELDEEDRHYLQEKEQEKEEAKSEPFFGVSLFPLEDGTTKIRIRDKRTDEKRSFIVKDIKRFYEVYDTLRKEKHLAKLSLDDYVKRLKNGVDESRT